jgi:hypothetical protein
MKKYVILLLAMSSFVFAQVGERLEYSAGGVIFRDELGKNLVHWSCTANVDIKDYFTPTTTDIADLEPLLLEASRAVSEVSLETYYRQYAGFVEKGQAIICINLIDKDYVAYEVDYARQYSPERLEQLSSGGAPEEYWMREIIAVLDGGKTFCQAEYEVAAKRIRVFRCNGEA